MLQRYHHCDRDRYSGLFNKTENKGFRGLGLIAINVITMASLTVILVCSAKLKTKDSEAGSNSYQLSLLRLLFIPVCSVKLKTTASEVSLTKYKISALGTKFWP